MGETEGKREEGKGEGEGERLEEDTRKEEPVFWSSRFDSIEE